MSINNKSVEILMKELVSIRSDTNTSYEVNIEKYIKDWIGNLTYFQNHNEYYGEKPLKNDVHNRAIVWALVKGTSSDTVILFSHHDAVDTFDYGSIREHAYKPEILKEKLKSLSLDNEVKNDLNSDDWIFGRGTADMKAGTALQLKIIEEYSNIKNFKGNLLFLSVPDEENLSKGMIQASTMIKKLKEKYFLNYVLAIDSEPHSRENDKYYEYYDGCIGKTMLSVYVQGKKTHISNIFEGINPSLILSKIVEKTEMNTTFCDKVKGFRSPAPSWSFVRDFKERYDASIPESSGGYISFQTLEKLPQDILKQFKEICNDAFCESIDLVNKNYKIFTENSSSKLNWKPRVLYYNELVQEAIDFNKIGCKKLIKKELEEINKLVKENNINLAGGTFKIIKALLSFIPDMSPTVVIALTPPYYPHVSINNAKSLNSRLLEIDDVLMKCGKEKLGIQVKNNSFMVLCDMSYLDFQTPEDIADIITSNMPLWGNLYNIPFNCLKKIAVPSMNIGPWGKDLHKNTERVYRPDLNINTIALTKSVIDFMLL